MVRWKRYSITLFFLLGAVMYGAAKDDVTHVFHDMSKDASQLTFDNSNKTGITPLLTYTCSGTSAEFGQDLFYKGASQRICINLPGSGRYVTTSAIDSLAGVQIQYYHTRLETPKVTLCLSRDSVYWSDPIVFSDTTFLITATNPNQLKLTATFTPGRYYVRITNTVGTRKVSIDRLVYSFGDCPNCFMYIEE